MKFFTRVLFISGLTVFLCAACTQEPQTQGGAQNQTPDESEKTIIQLVPDECTDNTVLSLVSASVAQSFSINTVLEKEILLTDAGAHYYCAVFDVAERTDPLYTITRFYDPNLPPQEVNQTIKYTCDGSCKCIAELALKTGNVKCYCEGEGNGCSLTVEYLENNTWNQDCNG